MARTTASGVALKSRPKEPTGVSQLNCFCLVGGKQILRAGIAELLKQQKLRMAEYHQSEEEFCHSLAKNSVLPFDLVILILAGGPFTAIYRVREALSRTGHSVPLVILSEHTGRGQVYAALRIGAKAYLDMDSSPEELTKALSLAAQGKVYLSTDVAELLVNDMSAAYEPTTKSQRLPSAELSRREVEIVQLLCEGLSSKEVARRLHLSAKTVENHRYNIYRKCNVDSIAALMRHAIQHGWISI